MSVANWVGGGGEGGGDPNPRSCTWIGCRKILASHYFKQYFTRYEFIKENFKPHLTLPFCKIHMSRISLSLNHAMRINSLQFFNILILDYVVSACQFVYWNVHILNCLYSLERRVIPDFRINFEWKSCVAHGGPGANHLLWSGHRIELSIRQPVSGGLHLGWTAQTSTHRPEQYNK